MITAFIGNLLSKPEVVSWFLIYFMAVGFCIVLVFLRVRLLKLLVKSAGPILPGTSCHLTSCCVGMGHCCLSVHAFFFYLYFSGCYFMLVICCAFNVPPPPPLAWGCSCGMSFEPIDLSIEFTPYRISAELAVVTLLSKAT